MAMRGINKHVEFKGQLEKSYESYKDILREVSQGKEVDKTKMLEFKGRIVNLMVLQGLNEYEMDQRDIFIDKFIALVDVISGLYDIRKEENLSH